MPSGEVRSATWSCAAVSAQRCGGKAQRREELPAENLSVLSVSKSLKANRRCCQSVAGNLLAGNLWLAVFQSSLWNSSAGVLVRVQAFCRCIKKD